VKVLTSEPNIHTDFSRLARWLTGTSVGLVLGGGGARGAAHVGMIKAIQVELMYNFMLLFQLPLQL
jgi:lysophospholipid hydrolase